VTGSLAACLEGASRLVVLGVGSELRSDDVAGLIVARRVQEAFPGSKVVLAIEGATAPENFTGEITRFKASHLVVVDCAEIEGEPGSSKIFPVEDIGGVSSNTHTLPLKIIIDYINSSHPCQTVVVGIAPKSLDFVGEPSPEVLAGAERVAAELIAIAKDMPACP
jgi:hydrogenase 3 maturation protease